MKHGILTTSQPVLLVGGGAIEPDLLVRQLGQPRPVVAADGGAEALIAAGCMPDLVVGDMDSLSPETAAAIPADRLRRVSEQDSTDFEKALRAIEAPLVHAIGFTGKRIDHELAVWSGLARSPERKVMVLGAEDAVTLCPPTLAIDLGPGTRVSLWPLAPVSGRSTGLRWPIDGIEMAPDGRIGTSNMAEGPIRLEIGRPSLLLILPVDAAPVLEAALRAAAPWPARVG